MRWALRRFADVARLQSRSEATRESAPYDNLAGAAYGALIEAELKDEADRRQSIEARAQTVISSVGAIVGIAVAVASLVGLGITSDVDRIAPSGSTPASIAESPSPEPATAASPAMRPTAAGVVASRVNPAVATLGAAGLGFAASVVFALFALLPTRYQVAHIDAIDRLTMEQFWAGPRPLGARRASEVRARELRWARIANARKSRFLQFAVILEVLGIYAIGILGFVVVAGRITSP